MGSEMVSRNVMMLKTSPPLGHNTNYNETSPMEGLGHPGQRELADSWVLIPMPAGGGIKRVATATSPPLGLDIDDI
jgi:hypothetical protein